MSIKALRKILGLDSVLKLINKVAKNNKNLVKLEDFNRYFKFLALKHTWRQLKTQQ